MYIRQATHIGIKMRSAFLNYIRNEHTCLLYLISNKLKKKEHLKHDDQLDKCKKKYFLELLTWKRK